jgi:steroid 5-alpha reductase family enzyme
VEEPVVTLPLVLFAWLVSALAMTLLWLWQRRSGNAAIVDVAWSFATATFGVAFALLLGEGPRRWLIAGVAALWGLRLGMHLWKRVTGDAHRDVRYEKMREEWGSRYDLTMFGFYQLQALWAVLFALPMAWAAWNRAPLGVLDALGVAIWLVGFAGEAAADRQLARFRARPESRGKVCDVGLWRYSRHPNYFFEWIQWFAYVCFAAGGDGRWLAWLGPAVMLWFLLRVTGVPLLERRLLESRGEAYRLYQRSTSAFFPWFPRRGTAA